MINVRDIISSEKLKSEEYIKSIDKKYTKYIEVSQYPCGYNDKIIDNNKLPKNLKLLYDNIYNIISNNFSYAFNFKTYQDTAYISGMLIDKYFKDTYINDTILKKVLYIDTNLLLDDYKKIIDMSEQDSKINLTYSKDTLNSDIETADFIFWDRFTIISSTYDKTKLYNILLSRKRKGLANIFFIKGGASGLSSIFDIETATIMNLSSLIDCQFEKPIYIETEENKIIW